MDVSISSNALAVAHELTGVTVRVQRAVERVTEQQARVFETKVKARASGRPGPRAQTGDYRRSINAQFAGRSGGRVRWEVGTNAVQGRRLEFGFWGLRDSLGRLFHQPPYPHFGPAADEMESALPAAVEVAVAAELAVFGP